MNRGPEYLQGSQKRRLDVLGSYALLGALAPVIVATGVACAIDGRRLNPLFIQERSNGDGSAIETYKFRTLTKDIGGIAADAVLGTFDPRSSRLGQSIRQLGLDEMPQIVNVIQGEMSLVGPRPVLASDLERYHDSDRSLFADWYPLYSAHKPGITGDSQLLRHHYRGVDHDLRTETMRLDLDYFEKASLDTDVSIIASTPLRMIRANIGVENVNDSADTV